LRRPDPGIRVRRIEGAPALDLFSVASKSSPLKPWLRIKLAALHSIPSPAQISSALRLVAPISEKI
jgi:hypothetical protein